jgi:hypothetical protein
MISLSNPWAIQSTAEMSRIDFRCNSALIRIKSE